MFYFLLHLILLPIFLPALLFSVSTTPPPSPSSAHVDMSTVPFDVDPLDLDAEEPPESQGEAHSSKGTSGSVTSPQASIHRLPFFKKVTLEAQDTSLTSPASLLFHPAFAPRVGHKLSFLPLLFLTNCSESKHLFCYCSSQI